ncbi:MAG: response regulator transcription factor [Bacteroidales bacterium]|nr:response regulator transcription factor [Bacteroidales bacterium]
MDILIVEDELHNQRLLQGMVLKIRPQWNIVHATDSVAGSVEWLRNHTPGLIFMDVQLIDGICFSIFEQTKTECPVIFTTAYDNYAIQAFKVNSIDYLLKPVKESELEQAISRFEKQFRFAGASKIADYAEIVEAIKLGEKKYRKRFLVQGTAAFYKIDVADIGYFYTENKICYAVDKGNKEHILNYTLENLEEELDPEMFFRANRNTVIHVDSVNRVEDYFGGKLHVTLVPPYKAEVIVSRLKNSAFKNWLGK